MKSTYVGRSRANGEQITKITFRELPDNLKLLVARLHHQLGT